MKISTKGRYALRLMIDLAINGENGLSSTKEIAERQDISRKYLEQIMTILNRAGFVKSERGSNGGYRLTRRPPEYTVGEILRLTEGSLAPVSCLDGDINTWQRQSACATLMVWKKLDDAIKSVVDNTTLQDLVDEQRLLDTSSYVI